MSGEAKAHRIVQVPKSYFWNRLRAFDEIQTLLPKSITEVKLPDNFSNKIGDIRYVYLDQPYKGEVIERLDGYLEESFLTYSIIDKSCLPMVNYVACVTLTEVSDSETDVHWCSHFVAEGAPEEEVVTMLEALYYLIYDNAEIQYKESQ